MFARATGLGDGGRRCFALLRPVYPSLGILAYHRDIAIA